WERLSDSLVHAGIEDEPDDPRFYFISMGFVGVEAAIAFRDYARNSDLRVSGADIMERYTVKKHKVRSRLQRSGVEALNAAIDKVADYINQNVAEALTETQIKNLDAFMGDLTGELRLATWSKLTADGIMKTELIKSIHKACAHHILDVFGVPMGPAGVGVVPNIPGFMEDQKAS